MNTRSTSDKAEVDNLYKIAIENQSKTNPRNPTLCTSTTTGSIKPKSIDFSLNDSVIAKDPKFLLIRLSLLPTIPEASLFNQCAKLSLFLQKLTKSQWRTRIRLPR